MLCSSFSGSGVCYNGSGSFVCDGSYIKLEVYLPEFREEICRLVIEGNRSATSVEEEFGIDKNTVCSWVRNYRRAHPLPSYAEGQGIMKSVREEESELKRKN